MNTNNMSVHITYRNARMEPVADQLYPLDVYVDMIRNDLIKIVSDTEDLLYTALDGKQRSDWPDDVWARFTKIRHKLLDKAADIRRLPECLIGGGVDDGQDL